MNRAILRRFHNVLETCFESGISFELAPEIDAANNGYADNGENDCIVLYA